MYRTDDYFYGAGLSQPVGYMSNSGIVRETERIGGIIGEKMQKLENTAQGGKKNKRTPIALKKVEYKHNEPHHNTMRHHELIHKHKLKEQESFYKRKKYPDVYHDVLEEKTDKTLKRPIHKRHWFVLPNGLPDYTDTGAKTIGIGTMPKNQKEFEKMLTPSQKIVLSGIVKSIKQKQQGEPEIAGGGFGDDIIKFFSTTGADAISEVPVVGKPFSWLWKHVLPAIPGYHDPDAPENQPYVDPVEYSIQHPHEIHEAGPPTHPVSNITSYEHGKLGKAHKGGNKKLEQKILKEVEKVDTVISNHIKHDEKRDEAQGYKGGGKKLHRIMKKLYKKSSKVPFSPTPKRHITKNNFFSK